MVGTDIQHIFIKVHIQNSRDDPFRIFCGYCHIHALNGGFAPAQFPSYLGCEDAWQILELCLDFFCNRICIMAAESFKKVKIKISWLFGF